IVACTRSCTRDTEATESYRTDESDSDGLGTSALLLLLLLLLVSLSVVLVVVVMLLASLSSSSSSLTKSAGSVNDVRSAERAGARNMPLDTHKLRNKAHQSRTKYSGPLYLNDNTMPMSVECRCGSRAEHTLPSAT